MHDPTGDDTARRRATGAAPAAAVSAKSDASNRPTVLGFVCTFAASVGVQGGRQAGRGDAGGVRIEVDSGVLAGKVLDSA